MTAPVAPACNGTEPLVTENETINTGTTKWYYGGTTTLNTITLKGGTMVICGDLTVDKLYMDSGTIFVRPGARFVIGSGIGSGLQFKGNCAIYNYGTCEVQRNLSLENNASAGRPNIVINALSSSIFRMPNQYFVINNAFSQFVNNGTSEFWGLITDNQATAGSVCLGNGSSTKMAILINRIANSYSVPGGNACVYVYQFSQFYGQLTSDPTLFACLSGGHTSDISCMPFGCTPNNWGAAQIFSNCAGCAAIAALQVQFILFAGVVTGSGLHQLNWQVNENAAGGNFTLLRSADGRNFEAIDSLKPGENKVASFTFIDKTPLHGNNYYMIRYTNPATGLLVNSKTVLLFAETNMGMHLYPVPFEDKFFIDYAADAVPEKILLTDVNGRNISTRHIIRETIHRIEVMVLDKLQSGVYIIHLLTNKSVIAKTIFKR